MIFASGGYLLTSAVVLFGLTLLAATLITRRQRPHPLLNKAIWLVAAGLLLAEAVGGAGFAALVAASAMFNYTAAQAIAHAREQGRSRAAATWLTFAFIVNALVLAAMKFAPGISLPTDVVVAGVSFTTLHAVSYLVDVHTGRVHARHDAGEAGVYLLLLPQFVAGPVSYHAASAQLARRSVGMSDFAYGVRRLAIGIGKRVFIAAPCGAAAALIFKRPPEQITSGGAWLAAVCFTIEIYFTFSAFADMAIGFGRLFGLRLEENFRWPYAAESIEDFWRRWHMGLASWFREYAVGRLPRRLLEGEALVVLLCAAWYGTTWGWIAWGVYHAAILTFERNRIINVSRLPAPLRHVYLVGVVVIGWVLLRAGSPSNDWLYLKAMAGFATPEHIHPLPLSFQLWAAIAAGALGSAPLARSLRRWSVAIDGATTSLVMMLFATGVFVWKNVTPREI